MLKEICIAITLVVYISGCSGVIQRWDMLPSDKIQEKPPRVISSSPSPSSMKVVRPPDNREQIPVKLKKAGGSLSSSMVNYEFAQSNGGKATIGIDSENIRDGDGYSPIVLTITFNNPSSQPENANTDNKDKIEDQKNKYFGYVMPGILFWSIVVGISIVAFFVGIYIWRRFKIQKP